MKENGIIREFWGRDPSLSQRIKKTREKKSWKKMNSAWFSNSWFGNSDEETFLAERLWPSALRKLLQTSFWTEKRDPLIYFINFKNVCFELSSYSLSCGIFKEGSVHFMAWMLGILARSCMEYNQAFGNHHVGRGWLSRCPFFPCQYPWDLLVKVVGAHIGRCRIDKIRCKITMV